MELPIQLSFFKKLDAYQALLEQNQRSETEPDRTKPWEKEKAGLAWAAQYHHHLSHPVTLHDFKKWLKRTGKFTGEENGIAEAMENLKIKGYATQGNTMASMVITRDGLIIGQVILDVEERGGYHRWKYPFWLLIGWLAVISAIIILFRNAYNALPFLPPFKEVVGYFLESISLRHSVIIGITSVLAGAVGHYIVSPVIDQSRKELKMQPIQPVSKRLGVIERFMYVIAWFMMQPEFIGLWLGLKTIGEWRYYKSEKNNSHDSGRGQFTVFLLGTGLSLIVAFMFIWLAEAVI